MKSPRGVISSSERVSPEISTVRRERTPAVLLCLVMTALFALSGCGPGSGGSSLEDVLQDLFSGPAPVAPSGLSYSAPPVYFVGTHIATLYRSLESGTRVRYTVSPDLPSGLSISFFNGAISGTPQVASPAASYTVLASNSSGSATAVLTIEVMPAPEPTDLIYSPSSLVGEVDLPIDPLFPTNSGGAIVAYSVEPELPAGLFLDSIGGAISGTPLEVVPELIFTVTGSGLGGVTSTVLTIEVAAAPSVGVSYGR